MKNPIRIHKGSLNEKKVASERGSNPVQFHNTESRKTLKIEEHLERETGEQLKEKNVQVILT